MVYWCRIILLLCIGIWCWQGKSDNIYVIFNSQWVFHIGATENSEGHDDQHMVIMAFRPLCIGGVHHLNIDILLATLHSNNIRDISIFLKLLAACLLRFCWVFFIKQLEAATSHKSRISGTILFICMFTAEAFSFQVPTWKIISYWNCLMSLQGFACFNRPCSNERCCCSAWWWPSECRCCMSCWPHHRSFSFHGFCTKVCNCYSCLCVPWWLDWCMYMM